MNGRLVDTHSNAHACGRVKWKGRGQRLAATQRHAGRHEWPPPTSAFQCWWGRMEEDRRRDGEKKQLNVRRWKTSGEREGTEVWFDTHPTEREFGLFPSHQIKLFLWIWMSFMKQLGLSRTKPVFNLSHSKTEGRSHEGDHQNGASPSSCSKPMTACESPRGQHGRCTSPKLRDFPINKQRACESCWTEQQNTRGLPGFLEIYCPIIH